MDKTRKINIPLSAFDIQIVKNHNNWYLKYKINKDEVKKIMIDKPCDIDSISNNGNNLRVDINLYTTKEYKKL